MQQTSLSRSRPPRSSWRTFSWHLSLFSFNAVDTNVEETFVKTRKFALPKKKSNWKKVVVQNEKSGKHIWID